MGAIYDNYVQRELTKDEAIAAFGKTRANTLLGGATTITVDSQLIEKGWDMADPSGTLSSMVIKRPNCTMGYYPLAE